MSFHIEDIHKEKSLEPQKLFESSVIGVKYQMMIAIEISNVN